MKPLDKINTPATWNVGAIVGVVSVVGIILTNPAALSALQVLLSAGAWQAKVGAVGVLLGVLAVAIGKPPATSPATKGP